MLIPGKQTLLEQQSAKLHELYDRYGGMLLGYLAGILKDQSLAEEYLIAIFIDLSGQHKINAGEDYTWCQLRCFAKNKLAILADSNNFENNIPVISITYNTANKFLDRMTDEQKQVFCNIYYYQKPVALLAKQLNRPEEMIRRTLMEAFAIIRKP